MEKGFMEKDLGKILCFIVQAFICFWIWRILFVEGVSYEWRGIMLLQTFRKTTTKMWWTLRCFRHCQSTYFYLIFNIPFSYQSVEMLKQTPRFFIFMIIIEFIALVIFLIPRILVHVKSTIFRIRHGCHNFKLCCKFKIMMSDTDR